MNMDTPEFVAEQMQTLNPEGYENLIDAFLASCRDNAGEDAFRCMGHSLTFRQLEGLTRNFAAFLQYETGLMKGDRIAIQLPNIPQYPIAAWGALRAGLILVNTNPMYTRRELAHQLEDSGAKGIVILDALLANHQETISKSGVQQVISVNPADLARPGPAPDLDLPGLVSFSDALARGGEWEFRDFPMSLSDTAVLQYTGGTTGVAKGAVLTQGNLLAASRISKASFPMGLEPGEWEVVIAPMPLYHVYGFAVNAIGMVVRGATSVLVPDPRNVDSLIDAMVAQPFTWMASVNTLLIALLQHPRLEDVDFSATVGIIAGGAPLVREVAEEWERRTGSKVFEGYGLSETTASGGLNNRDHYCLGTIGRCVRHTEAKVVDDAGNRLGSDEAGELLIRGPQVMKGYWQNPEGTEEAFDEEGWVRTGDIATIDENGFIRIVDRKKDMVLVSGFNVYPTEVESVLYGHPDIVECAVIGVPDEKCGEAVKAFVVSRNPNLTEDVVRAHCREELTGYKVPREVAFVDALPKSAVGKILRRELREQDSS